MTVAARWMPPECSSCSESCRRRWTSIESCSWVRACAGSAAAGGRAVGRAGPLEEGQWRPGGQWRAGGQWEQAYHCAMAHVHTTEAAPLAVGTAALHCSPAHPACLPSLPACPACLPACQPACLSPCLPPPDQLGHVVTLILPSRVSLQSTPIFFLPSPLHLLSAWGSGSAPHAGLRCCAPLHP